MKFSVFAMCMSAVSTVLADVVEIRTAADLQAVAKNLGATYELMNDIDLSGVSFGPIGGVNGWGADEFTGTFHGNGHKISGLKINDTGSYGYVGFFRETSGATITDLQIFGEVTGQNKNCGGLVGRSVVSYFSNCVVQVAISGGQYTGGFVGDDSGSRYVRCVARGTLQVKNTYCGGFVGRAAGEYRQCVSSMSASAPKGDGGWVEYGGFVGVNNGATFRDCAATGNLTVKNNNYFGGFVGCAATGKYYDCYSAVDITLRKGGRTGGFAGALGDENNLFTRCYVCGTLECGPGTYDIGGFIGDAQGQDAASMMTGCRVVSEMDPNTVKTKAAWPDYFTEDGAWGMIEGETLPYLRFRSKIEEGVEKPVYSVSVSIVGAGEATIPDYLDREAVAGDWVKVAVECDDANCSQFLGWEGDCEYETREETPTWVKVDRDVNAIARVEIGIWNADDLARVGTDFNGKEVTLMQDLELVERPFDRIGTESNPYTGTFNGDGHVITLRQDYTNQNNCGFFGYVKGATVRNLTLCGSVKGKNTVGGVIGCADGDKGVTLEDVTFVGEVKGVNYVGGVIGSSNGRFSATRCAAIANVVGNNQVAGFARYLGNYETSVVECFAVGSVTCTNSSYGAAGFIYSANRYGATVSNCYARTELSARYAYPLFCDEPGKKHNVYSGDSWDAAIASDPAWLLEEDCSPVLKWSAPDGKVRAYAFDDAIAGADAYALGSDAAVSCTPPSGKCFLRWCGAAAYADPSAATTTVRMTNHQLLSCEYGVLATTAAELIDGLHGNLSGTVVLGADLDLAPYEWQNVGTTSGRAFKGRLVGNGHTVRGLDKPIFNYVDGAEISDVTFMGVMRDQTDYLAGAVRRVGKNGVTMRRVTFVGELHGRNNVGGLIGNSDGPVIANQCAAVVNIVGYNYLCGFAYRFNSDSKVNECFAIASITSTNSSGDVVGFAGYANDSQIDISNCYVQAELKTQDKNRKYPFLRFPGSTCRTVNCYSGTDWPVELESDDHWLMQAGCSPVLKWSAPDGKVNAYAFDPGVVGAGSYALGSDAGISCVPPSGKMFAAWAGSAPYADKNNIDTTVRMVNHQLLSCEYGVAIRSAAELQAITNDVNGLYGLANDIDLGGIDWVPLCNDRYRGFRGKFYGKGHRITGLFVSAPEGRDSKYDYRGLFGCLDGGTLSGVKVSGVVAGSANVGGLVGYAKGAAVIENCEADVAVRGYEYVGGLVGKIDGPVAVTSSKAKGEVVSSYGYVGGFVSYDYEGARFTDCEACGNVICAGTSAYVGGFVGWINWPSVFTNCTAYGDVSSSGGEYGGFMGRMHNSSAKIVDCAGYGNVIGSNGYYGKFCGRCFSGTITGCETAANRNEGMPLDYDEKLTAEQVVQVVYDPEPWKAEYERWAESHGVTGGIAATTGDIPNVFRFAFGIGADKNLADLEEPLLKIEFVGGKPVLCTPAIVAEGIAIAVIASSDLADWSGSSRVGMDYDATSHNWTPQGTPPQTLFFRLSANID